MKFVSMTLHNFMRYKGDNTIEFSCDDDKNVTVVLGDNTHGKTTLAQAFRWGLYSNEGLKSTNYIKAKDIVLLNNEVIEKMSFGQRQSVSVEIVICDATRQWKFMRTAYFRRRNPSVANDLSIVRDGDEELVMIITENGIQGIPIKDNGDNRGDKQYQYEGCVQNTINSMFPQKLASYLFFDGERWSDAKVQKSEIKDSINTILGVNAFIEMARHIKTNTRHNAISILRKNIKGSSDESIRLLADINDYNDKIILCEDEIKSAQANLASLSEARDNNWRILNDNKRAEEDQRELARLQRDITTSTQYSENRYADIVELFSKQAAQRFASSLLPEVEKMFAELDLEGKDIPGVTTDTVDYLVHQMKCLCGHSLAPGTLEYENIMALRKVIPPEMIGGAAGHYSELLSSWEKDTADFIGSIERKADEQDSFLQQKEEAEDKAERLEKRIDKKSNMEQVRKTYNNLVSACRDLESQIATLKTRIEEYEKNRDIKQTMLDKIAKEQAGNALFLKAIGYAESLYEMAESRAKKAKDGVFEELNEIIKENFSKMFNDAEKYAVLGSDDYRIHVYYHSVGSVNDHEETNLSNGEMVAINFVYITSVLELARRRAAAQEGLDSEEKSDIINLPLVLDGPFSTLSNDNTNLIAQKIPSFAEQVIIFMLDKDWTASGFDSVALPKYCYRITKGAQSNNSTIGQKGVED